MGVVWSLASCRSVHVQEIGCTFLNAVYPTAPSGQVFSVLVVHYVLLQTAVALVLKHFSVQACNADFFSRYHMSDHIQCCVSGFVIE